MTNRATFRLSLIFFAVCAFNEARALPPLGLTQITPATNVDVNLEIIDGTAYLSATNGIWTVDPLGTTAFVAVADPSPVVKAYDGGLYFVTTGRNGGSLRRFDQPQIAVRSWSSGHAVGVDSQLRVGVEPHGDGSIYFVTPKGYAYGSRNLPGTLGDSPALWGPDGQFVGFYFGIDVANSIRERNDGNGVNATDGQGGLILGETTTEVLPSGLTLYNPEYSLFYPDGKFPDRITSVVSHTDFMVMNNYRAGAFAFYPGINPAFPDRVVPLVNVFPQLATIGVDAVSSAASVDGYLYLTIRGSNGLYLFGAPDPSLVPEPATFALMLAMVLPGILKRV